MAFANDFIIKQPLMHQGPATTQLITSNKLLEQHTCYIQGTSTVEQKDAISHDTIPHKDQY